eukprot:g9014.t1
MGLSITFPSVLNLCAKQSSYCSILVIKASELLTVAGRYAAVHWYAHVAYNGYACDLARVELLRARKQDDHLWVGDTFPAQPSLTFVPVSFLDLPCIVAPVAMHPKKKADEPAPAPQEPVAPAPAVEAKVEEKDVGEARQKMDEVSLNVGGSGSGSGKYTPIKITGGFFLEMKDDDLTLFSKKQDGKELPNLEVVGSKSSTKRLISGQTMWVSFFDDGSQVCHPTLYDSYVHGKDKVALKKIIKAKFVN